MADLFHKQSKQYSEARPTYPPELFKFIASKTPAHDLAWDVGTGTGQAIKPLAEIYKVVIGTDTSAKQLSYAPTLPNARYHHTPPTIPLSDLDRIVSPPSTVDLVTVAQALHWFDLPNFYSAVKRVLKKPSGVIAVWCYTLPEVDTAVDAVMRWLYEAVSRPYWDKARGMVDDAYRGIEFPFEPVDGMDSTDEPVRFTAEVRMELEGYLRYVKSWSAYNTAAEMGMELLTEEVVERFRRAWGGGDGRTEEKIVRFPVYLRIGRVGICNHCGCI